MKKEEFDEMVERLGTLTDEEFKKRLVRSGRMTKEELRKHLFHELSISTYKFIGDEPDEDDEEEFYGDIISDLESGLDSLPENVNYSEFGCEMNFGEYHNCYSVWSGDINVVFMFNEMFMLQVNKN